MAACLLFDEVYTFHIPATWYAAVFIQGMEAAERSGEADKLVLYHGNTPVGSPWETMYRQPAGAYRDATFRLWCERWSALIAARVLIPIEAHLAPDGFTSVHDMWDKVQPLYRAIQLADGKTFYDAPLYWIHRLFNAITGYQLALSLGAIPLTDHDVMAQYAHRAYETIFPPDSYQENMRHRSARIAWRLALGDIPTVPVEEPAMLLALRERTAGERRALGTTMARLAQRLEGTTPVPPKVIEEFVNTEVRPILDEFHGALRALYARRNLRLASIPLVASGVPMVLDHLPATLATFLTTAGMGLWTIANARAEEQAIRTNRDYRGLGLYLAMDRFRDEEGRTDDFLSSDIDPGLLDENA